MRAHGSTTETLIIMEEAVSRSSRHGIRETLRERNAHNGNRIFFISCASPTL
jgi:hypothetical protein